MENKIMTFIQKEGTVDPQMRASPAVPSFATPQKTWDPRI